MDEPLFYIGIFFVGIAAIFFGLIAFNAIVERRSQKR
jgi:hypothetical protein